MIFGPRLSTGQPWSRRARRERPALSPFFGITLASRVGSDLYYLLADPTGQAVVVADETGQEAGHILYDPLGEVITTTLPPALAETLAGSLDPDTGLQYHGARFYDPETGGYVQPDPFGGMGGVETSTRYSQDSTIRFDLALILSISANKYLGYYGDLTRYISTSQFTGWQRRRIAQPFWQFSSRPSGWGELRTEAAPATLHRLGLLDFFEPDPNALTPGGNRTAYITRELVEQVGTDLYRTESGAIVDMAAALNLSTRRWLRSPSFTPGQIATRNAYYRRVLAPTWREMSALAKFGLKNGLPFGIDATWQLYADRNINMPIGHRLGRAGVAAGVGLVTGAVVEGGLFLLLGTSPPGWAVIGVSVIVGLTLEPTVTDVVYNVTHLKVD